MAPKRMTIAAVILLLVVTFFADGGRGEECQDKAWACEAIASGAAAAVLKLYEDKPFNLTAAMFQCRSTEEAMARCEEEVQSLCSLTNRINGTFASMRNTFRSVCKPDTVCGYKINECRPNRTMIEAVRDTVHQRPMNLALVREKCSDLNKTVAPCVATLKTECSHANSAKNFISTITSSVDNLCGKDVLCRFQSLQCTGGISGIHDIGDAVRQRPPNVKLVLEKCSAMNATVAPCVAKLKEDCSEVSSIKSTLSSLTSTLNSLCGQDVLCGFQSLQCTGGISRIHDIGDAVRQRPPNVKLVLEKCSAMNATVAPCVAKLKEDCSEVSSIKSTLSSLTSTFNSLCGQESLCQLKMHHCQTLFASRVHAKSEDRQAHICRTIQQFLDCQKTDVGGSCLSLPSIKQVLNEIRSAFSGIKCSSGGQRVMESFTLILLMTAVTAWTTTPFL